MAKISRRDAEAYLARWQLVREAEIAELRRTPMEAKLRQVAALVGARDSFAADADREREVEEVRRRWALLRQGSSG